MKTSYKLLLGATALLGISFLGSQAAMADTPNGPTVEIIHGTGSVSIDQVSRIAEAMASRDGISLEASISKYGPQISAQSLDLVESAVLGDNLLRMGYERGIQRIVIRHRLSVQQLSYLESMPIDIEVTIDPTILPLEDLHKISSAIADQVWNAVPGSMFAWPDPYNNSIHLALQPNVGLNAISQVGGDGAQDISLLEQNIHGLVDPSRLAATEDVIKTLLPLGIDGVIEVWDATGSQAQSYVTGGANLNVGTSYCSSSFVVANPTSVGILTTAHCTAGITSYEGQAVVGAPVTSGVMNGDLAILKLNGAQKTATFDSGTNVQTDVTGVADPKGGDIACVHGQITAFKCDIVNSAKGRVINDAGLTGDGMVTMFTQDTQPGDSGSAWFNGSIAEGVTWGVITVKGSWVSVFAAISDLQATGWHVVKINEVNFQ